DLMAERERQLAAGGDVEPFVVAEREIAVLQVQVGMAHAAALDAQEHFVAAGCRTVDEGFAERLAVGDERLTAHLGHSGPLLPASCAGAGLEPAPRRARPRERYEAGDEIVLAPRGGVRAGRRDQCRRVAAERAQALAQ